MEDMPLFSISGSNSEIVTEALFHKLHTISGGGFWGVPLPIVELFWKLFFSLSPHWLSDKKRERIWGSEISLMSSNLWNKN